MTNQKYRCSCCSELKNDFGVMVAWNVSNSNEFVKICFDCANKLLDENIRDVATYLGETEEE